MNEGVVKPKVDDLIKSNDILVKSYLNLQDKLDNINNKINKSRENLEKYCDF